MCGPRGGIFIGLNHTGHEIFATNRTESDDLVAVGRDVSACVERELDLQRLTDIFGRLWLVGLLIKVCHEIF